MSQAHRLGILQRVVRQQRNGIEVFTHFQGHQSLMARPLSATGAAMAGPLLMLDGIDVLKQMQSSSTDDLRMLAGRPATPKEMSMKDHPTAETNFQSAAAFSIGPGDHLRRNTTNQARDPQSACLTAVVATVAAAVSVIALVWSIYDSFDHNGFDIHSAVVAPVMAVLGPDAPRPASAQGVASAGSTSTIQPTAAPAR